MMNKLPLSLKVLVAGVVCTSIAVVLSAFQFHSWLLFLSPFLALGGIALSFATAFLANEEMKKQASSDGNTNERAERQRRWMHGGKE